MEKKVRGFSDSKLEKELAFARGFAPATSPEEQDWLNTLEAEKNRRTENSKA
jgi:hypothetical protein